MHAAATCPTVLIVAIARGAGVSNGHSSCTFTDSEDDLAEQIRVVPIVFLKLSQTYPI